MQLYLKCSLIFLLFQLTIVQHVGGQTHNKLSKTAIEDILQKINKISVQSLFDASKSNIVEILKNVEEKLIQAAKPLGKKGDDYVKLIMKGLREKVFGDNGKTVITDTQREIPVDVVKTDITTKDKRKIITPDVEASMETVKILVDDTDSVFHQEENNLSVTRNDETTRDGREIHKNEEVQLKNKLRRMNIATKENNNIHNRENDLSPKASTSTEDVMETFTPSYECENLLDRACLNIKQMRHLKCYFGDTDVSIEKLCDGFVNCPDRTDEQFCASQVAERIQNANEVISEADQLFSLDCFPENSKQSLMTTDIVIFRSVLLAQQEFIEKYRYLNWSIIPNSGSFSGDHNVKQNVHELSLIIKTLSLALDAVFCLRKKKDITALNTRRFNGLVDLDRAAEEVEWPPKCKCQKGICKNDPCTDTCRRICWQTFNLARWRCESIDKTESVPIRVICDGKYDCYDQSDEEGCVTGATFAKFEAHKTFNEMLTALTGKISSTDYSSIRGMVLTMRSLIENLQKSCLASEPDDQLISTLRSKCFSFLGSIYWEAINKSSIFYETENIYAFLVSLNKKLVNALKHSNTGNKRIISNNRCFCRDGRCAMTVCSRKCVRACIAEPRLTKYGCRGFPNISVALDEICNGKTDCPSEDDESGCQKDVCRLHHLMLLRHILEDVGKKREGTSMGELLTAWRTKALSTLSVAENNVRPTRNIIKDIIRAALNDLVETYGALENYRRKNEYALEEFANIAKDVLKVLRSCGY